MENYLKFFRGFMRERTKILRIMKLTMIFLLVGMLQLSANVYSQNGKISVEANKMELSELLWQLQESSGIVFVYKTEDLKGLDRVTVSKQDVSLTEILDEVLINTNLEYTLKDDVVTIKKAKVPEPKQQQQKDQKSIKGKVVDETGRALPGVAVQVQGTYTGVATNLKGRYSIEVKPNDALRFSFVGYKTQLILIADQKELDVQLKPDVNNIEEVSVVAFGEQKKESVVSSITSVKSERLKSSNSDLTSTLAGNVAGLIGWQTGGAPGAMTEDEMNTKFYIRGITSFQSDANIDPLILMDGVEVSKLDLARIDPDDIESFNVMKDASATAMYGARGANGVIYVKTKRGKAGNVYASFRYEKIWSMPTRNIDVVDPVNYMKLYNEASMGRFPGSSPFYTKDRIDKTGSDKYPSYVYPSNDWYDKLFKNYNINNHYALNVRGGSDKVQYYSSCTYNDDSGMIKTDDLNQFDSNINVKQLTFRTNLNIDLNKNSKLALNTFITYDKYRGPAVDVSNAYYLAFQANPVDFAPTYPKDDNFTWPHIRFGATYNSANPYAALQSGYKDRVRFATTNRLEYIKNLSSLCKGLEVRGIVSMVTNSYFQSSYSYIPAYYSLQAYDHTTGEHTLTSLNESSASQALQYNDGDSKKDALTSLDYQFKAMHSAAWGDHQTSLMAVVQAQERNNSAPYDVLSSLPQRNLGYSARATYGYKSRYFIEASAGYNGSERFSKENKMGFFPAIGAAWVVSKEDFLRSTSNWLDFLKFRFSYGRVGNDGVIKDPRFVYLQQIQPNVGGRFGINGSKTIYKTVYTEGNPETTWEVSEQANFGTEIKLFNKLIDLNVDVYKEVRHNIYSYRNVIPLTMGLLRPPLANVGKVEAHGLDLALKIQHAFSSDFWFLLNGTFTYNKATYKKVEEISNKFPWQNKVGREISQQFGYVAEGLFQDQTEIDNSPGQSGNVMPGDIRYRDIDGNGMIDINDVVPIGHPETPRVIYGMSGFIHYKGFEFNISFQGSGNRSFFIDPNKISPFDENRAVLSEIAKDHWTPDNQKAKPFWPRLSVENIITHNPQEDYYGDYKNDIVKSTYFMKNGKFLRCRSIEFAAYLNKSWVEKFKIKNCKLYCRANNPFVISDFKVWDVELGGNGFNYPIQKTYSLGVNLSF